MTLSSFPNHSLAQPRVTRKTGEREDALWSTDGREITPRPPLCDNIGSLSGGERDYPALWIDNLSFMVTSYLPCFGALCALKNVTC